MIKQVFLIKKWVFDPKNMILEFLTSNNHFLKCNTHFFVTKKFVIQFYTFTEKKMQLSSKKMANRPLKHPKMHFSPKAPEERFSLGHILSREVTWTFKNQVPTLLMHLDPEGCHGGQWLVVGDKIRTVWWQVTCCRLQMPYILGQRYMICTI